MPCRDHMEPSVSEKLDKITELLCYVMTEVTERDRNIAYSLQHSKTPFSSALRVWWKEHQIIDAERKRRKAEEKEIRMKMQAARNKLTKEEQELLGL